MDYHIEAISVNHNTSSYLELMLRSLFARHSPSLNLTLTVFDNASTDDRSGLLRFAGEIGVPVQQSGCTTETNHNSHGEILQRFVLEHPRCSHYLFLDADVCFVQQDTIPVMLRELEGSDDLFGIGARMSWDGVTEIPEDVRNANPDLYQARLHPCCALVKNTEIFRDVVREIGLSCVEYLWADHTEYLDTFKLMTRVMTTHGLHHGISSQMVLHFFAVSYNWEPIQLREHKQRRCNELLAMLRHLQT